MPYDIEPSYATPGTCIKGNVASMTWYSGYPKQGAGARPGAGALVEPLDSKEWSSYTF